MTTTADHTPYRALVAAVAAWAKAILPTAQVHRGGVAAVGDSPGR
jgi:hypothetical protein